MTAHTPPLTPDGKFPPKKGRRTSEGHSSDWTLSRLVEACQRKNIAYEETNLLRTMKGFVVQCGKAISISVCSALDESDKTWILAHQLAHVALNHLAYAPLAYLREPLDSAPAPIADVTNKEFVANIWAAHALVDAQSYKKHWRKAYAVLHDKEQAQAEAIQQTAKDLKIPCFCVEYWIHHQRWRFEESPKTWLQHALLMAS